MPKRSLATATCFLLLGASLTAAVVNWGTPTVAIGPSEIDNGYSLLTGESGNPTPLTLNGVTFDSLNAVNSISIESANDHYQFGNFNSGDAGYDALITHGFYTPSNSLPSNITFSNLSIGQTYHLQFWVGAWNGTYPTSFTAGNTVDMGNSQNIAKWVEGTFVADAVTQVVSYHGTGGGYGILAAVAIGNGMAAPVPEPATYAVIGGMAALGLAFVLKRRTRAT